MITAACLILLINFVNSAPHTLSEELDEILRSQVRAIKNEEKEETVIELLDCRWRMQKWTGVGLLRGSGSGLHWRERVRNRGVFLASANIWIRLLYWKCQTSKIPFTLFFPKKSRTVLFKRSFMSTIIIDKLKLKDKTLETFESFPFYCMFET